MELTQYKKGEGATHTVKISTDPDDRHHIIFTQSTSSDGLITEVKVSNRTYMWRYTFEDRQEPVIDDDEVFAMLLESLNARIAYRERLASNDRELVAFLQRQP
jgi:hypothetical protein